MDNQNISRKKFLNFLGLAGVAVAAAPVIAACKENPKQPPFGPPPNGGPGGPPMDEPGTSTVNKNAACGYTNSETQGPFPTKEPSTLVKNNIVGDRTGIPLKIKINVQNNNKNCENLEGAIVDIWHCDKDGNYSEYGGMQMQKADYKNAHFLRGRQTTDKSGNVEFTSIFPGWYMGRATHIHVHIYDASGKSLLVTQIAFPEGKKSQVVQVNSAKDKGYTKGMNGYTYNSKDNVFGDGVEKEMSRITGDINKGFELNHTIKVSA